MIGRMKKESGCWFKGILKWMVRDVRNMTC